MRLRPHAKTHKSRAIAALQAEAGAVGICCATLHEAEQLAGSAPSVLLTSPTIGDHAAARIASLIRRGVSLAVAVDNSKALADIGTALGTDGPLEVFVDVDPGMGRSGVTSPGAAVALAQAIANDDRFRFGGIQFYCGSEQHIHALAARRAALEVRNDKLSATIRALQDAGLKPPVVTGGGTGTHGIDVEFGLLTEIQPGSYIFMDQDYGVCELGGAGPFELSLTVHATVVSVNHSGWVTIDAGIKALATDSGQPVVVNGAPAGSVYRFTGDEFGRLDIPDNFPPPAVGSRVVLAAPHCDPTVNLHGLYHVIQESGSSVTWPAEGRGYSPAV